PRHISRRVEHDRRGSEARDLRLACVLESSLQRAARRLEPPRVPHSEPVQEHHRVGPWILELEHIRPFPQYTRLEHEIQALRDFSIPPGLADVLTVHPDAYVMIDDAFEIARALEVHRQVTPETRYEPRHCEVVASAHRRNENVPQPKVRRLEKTRLVVHVLFPDHVLQVPGHRPRHRGPGLHAPPHPAGPPRLQLVDRIPERVQRRPCAQEEEPRARSISERLGLHVEGDALAAMRQPQARNGYPSPDPRSF